MMKRALVALSSVVIFSSTSNSVVAASSSASVEFTLPNDLELQKNKPSYEEQLSKSKEEERELKHASKKVYEYNSKFRKATKEEKEQLRRQMWNFNQETSDEYITPNFLADSGASYDKWQQAYRVLGIYIDCDHPQSANTWDYDNNPYYQEEVNNAQCARYYVWCSYIDPNYQGGGRDEYQGGDGDLDCHNDDTEWQILGCYRQEMYNTIEQLSKHIWSAYDDEYAIACSALDYMTKYDCRQMGYDGNGNVLYGGVKPLSGGYFQMALYKDYNCLEEDTESGYTYDDFANDDYNNYHDRRLGGSHDEEEQYHYDYDGDYTMEDINDVMDSFKYCTLCMDYPTYQDGSENNGDAYDDDNLINQCWKFWSHASYPCNTDCIAMATSQGTVLSVEYGSFAFGSTSSSSSFFNADYQGGTGGTTTQYITEPAESKFDKMKANAFLILAGVVFLTTFLSFGIARSSLHKSNESVSGQSRLTSKSRKTRSKSRTGEKSRSKSRSRRMLDDDYESDRFGSRRSKSRSRHRSQSRSRRYKDEEPRKERSPSKRRNYEAPVVPDGKEERTRDRERKSSRRNKEERERRQRDDF